MQPTNSFLWINLRIRYNSNRLFNDNKSERTDLRCDQSSERTRRRAS
jgi:hypothetical protein